MAIRVGAHGGLMGRGSNSPPIKKRGVGAYPCPITHLKKINVYYNYIYNIFNIVSYNNYVISYKCQIMYM